MAAAGPDSLERLIADVAAHKCGLYRDHWGASRDSALPPMSRDILRIAPLSARRYKDERALVKIVRDAGGSFLSEWSFNDLAREPFAPQHKRPMSYFSNSHETLEKALWCQLHGMPGFAAERDPAIAAAETEAYCPDALLTDVKALGRLAPYLRTRLHHLSIIGGIRELSTSSMFFPLAERVTLVLALPETGVIATSSPEMFPQFTVADCIVEKGPVHFVTKTRLLTTPIIRYAFDAGDAQFI